MVLGSKIEVLGGLGWSWGGLGWHWVGCCGVLCGLVWSWVVLGEVLGGFGRPARSKHAVEWKPKSAPEE